MRLANRVAIVTGGAQGIGRAYSLRFAEEGAAVAVLDLREEQAMAVEAEIAQAGGRAMTLVADVTDEAGTEAAFRSVAERFGRIDILMNNAALYYDLDSSNQSIDYMRKVMDINVFGVINCSRAAFPFMKEQRSGSIINIASVAAYPRPVPSGGRRTQTSTISLSAYGLSKHGVLYVTRSMAQAVGRYNIRINAIAPGVIMTEATKRAVGEDFANRLVEESVMGRAMHAEDLVGTAAYLASDDSAMMTGQTLIVDGGNVSVG